MLLRHNQSLDHSCGQVLLSHVLSHKSFHTSTIFDKISDLAGSTELDSRMVYAGKRVYFIDLKSNDNNLFIKMKEKSNQRQSQIFFDQSLVPEVLKAFKLAHTPEPYSLAPNSYVTLTSKIFEHKTLEIFARENDNGRFIVIQENYSGGIRMGMRSQLLIAIENLTNVATSLDELNSSPRGQA